MSSTVKEIKEKTGYLKRSDLYTIGVGQAIGSGVLTLIGPAILLTGQSAWLAYVAACIWGFMMIAPIPWITSTLKLGGGFYSLVGDMAGKRVAGMYAVGFLPQTINLATYGVAIGMYANSLWPQINAKWFGIASPECVLCHQSVWCGCNGERYRKFWLSCCLLHLVCLLFWDASS